MSTENKSIVAVIDYGMGNLHSVAKSLEHVADANTEIVVTSDPKVIDAADRVLLPGVGAIRDCIGEMRKQGLIPTIQKAMAEKPFLAICVGIQSLMAHSEENGGVDCLNHFQGNAYYFGNDHRDVDGTQLKVPHMGWNQVKHTMDHPLWQGIEDGARFYFVHSFYILAENQSEVAGTCNYGHDFCVALARDNVFAVQFHPEKSHKDGLQLYKNFIHWDGKP
ncbi:imidazole glycerol phosphate synthase subunit HisH [Marinomonas ostreistagni]|uniref:imidazole glycerol phosphate synthase subunit HisH n=1 Tax=Marinomonas ostreistagni TaxID=359209 RepID=UPI001950ACA7|nr:imidazole glycerol phosphate synthase subunit HisH [Marinomonas ostreistagni]MBM6552237.1 imidazole glycerol phosphate synthase subunit HisH [Marinomonas ostreistagni]